MSVMLSHIEIGQKIEITFRSVNSRITRVVKDTSSSDYTKEYYKYKSCSGKVTDIYDDCIVMNNKQIIPLTEIMYVEYA